MSESETPTRLDRGQINSIVLGVAENKARNMGIKVDPGALDALLRKAQRNLDIAFKKRQLDERKDEITANTETLIDYIVSKHADLLRGGHLTVDKMAFSLKDFCTFFEDLFPFCP